MKKPILLAALFFALIMPQTFAAETAATPAACGPECKCAEEAAYKKTINERADKIVAALKIDDAAKALRARDAVAKQYGDLRDIHDARDAALKKAKTIADKSAREAADAAVKADAQARLDALHAAFLAKLGAELTLEQIDGVKNGLTYNVLNVTYNAYMKMLPDLTTEQKKQVMDWLVEAREKAMDEGTSNAKHAVFGKYKGRINNYFSKLGINMKEAEKNLTGKK